MYAIKFENLYFEKVWGGRELELFRDNLPKGNIGKSWDVACHKNGMSIVANGEFKGKRLDELIKEKGTELLGTKIDKDGFPLLIKLINTKDSYEKELEGEIISLGVSEVIKKGDSFLIPAALLEILLKL